MEAMISNFRERRGRNATNWQIIAFVALFTKQMYKKMSGTKTLFTLVQKKTTREEVFSVDKKKRVHEGETGK